MDTRKKQMEQSFHLEAALLRQRQTLKKTEETLRQAKYALRQAQQAEVEYGGSLRALLDRISGKAEQKKEELTQRIYRAKGRMQNAENLLSSLREDIRDLTAEREALPDWQTQGKTAEGEEKELWAELEIRLCAQTLLPLLERLEEALEVYRSQLRGERMGEIVSYQELHERGTGHIGVAESCAPLLQRLTGALTILDRSLEIGGYFDNPAGFIDSAAARHNRIDRVNQALFQTAALKKQIKTLV